MNKLKSRKYQRTVGDNDGTPLHAAARDGNLRKVRTLVGKGALIDARTSSGNTPLLLAADKGKENIVTYLIAEGANVNCCNNKNWTVLHYASRNGWTEIAGTLVSKGVDIDSQTNRGYTPLLLAADNKHEDIVELLLSKDVNVYSTDSSDNTVLHYASRNGWTEIVSTLLQTKLNRETKETYIHLKNNIGNSAVLLAAHNKHKSVVLQLLRARAPKLFFILRGKQQESINCSSRRNKSLLHYASENGWLEVLEIICSKGTDIHAKDDDGNTPLLLAVKNKHKNAVEFLLVRSSFGGCDNLNRSGCCNNRLLLYASQTGLLEVVQFLLKEGVDMEYIDKTNGGCTALFMAAQSNQRDIVKLLIDAGANINCSGGWNNFTMLHYASKNGWLEIAQSVLDRGVDIDAKNYNGNTALLLAADGKQEDIVKLLINAGADCHCCGINKWTVLSYATRNGWLEVVQSLLEKGVDTNAKTYNGNAALLLAADSNYKDIVLHLINAGADVNSRDCNEWTVLHHASRRDWVEIVQYLLEKGVDINAKTNRGYTPLLVAAERCSEAVASFLIFSEANLNCTDNSKWTLLHYAARNGWLDITRSLLEKKLNIDAVTSAGCTALLIACSYNKPEVIGHLINAGANVNLQSNQRISPFSELIKKSTDMKLISLLIGSGAYVESTDYETILNLPVLKEGILEDAQLCSQSIINKFNHKDLPELYKLYGEKLPHIEQMKIANSNHVNYEVTECVKFQIQSLGFCEVLRVRPIVLKMIAVKTLINYHINKTTRNNAKKMKTS